MISIEAKVISGYGVASGKGNDPRYPEGTLLLQMSFFKERGLNLEQYFRGTINLDIAPYQFSINTPTHFFKGIDWSDHIPPENFYFFEVQLIYEGRSYEGLIYMPDPKTKADHHQISNMLEVIMPHVKGLKGGEKVQLNIPKESLQFTIEK